MQLLSSDSLQSTWHKTLRRVRAGVTEQNSFTMERQSCIGPKHKGHEMPIVGRSLKFGYIIFLPDGDTIYLRCVICVISICKWVLLNTTNICAGRARCNSEHGQNVARCQYWHDCKFCWHFLNLRSRA